MTPAEQIRALLDDPWTWSKFGPKKVGAAKDALDALEAERRLAAMTPRQRGAALMLRADIRCSNGCGCEEYDYCAADEWDNAVVAERLGEKP